MGGHRVLQGGQGAGSVPQSRGVLLGVWLCIVRGRCRASLQSFGAAQGRNGFSRLQLWAVHTQWAGGGFAFKMQLGCTERCWGCPCTPAKVGCPPTRSCPKAPLPLAVLPRCACPWAPAVCRAHPCQAVLQLSPAPHPCRRSKQKPQQCARPEPEARPCWGVPLGLPRPGRTGLEGPGETALMGQVGGCPPALAGSVPAVPSSQRGW